MLVNLAAARGPDFTLGGPSWAAAHALVNTALQRVQLIGCGDRRAGVQTVRQNITELSVTKTLCCLWRAVKGYV